MESYAGTIRSSINSMDSFDSNFSIVKYTNNDRNVTRSKNSKTEVHGYCRSLSYNMGNFFITLTDKLEDELPNQSVKGEKATEKKKSVLEVADELKKLKELLDLEVITEDEYKKEKDKLLNGK